jgi:hypothetical protein
MLRTALALVLAAAGTHSTTVFRIQDPALDEASSLVDLGSVMVSANDSGHPPLLFLLDARTGATRRTITYAAAQTDVEALAPAGAHAVWVGDIGDNLLRRPTVSVLRVPLNGGDVVTYRLRYPDGPHDAEALLSIDGHLTVVTKGVFGGHAYAAPRRLSTRGVNVLRRVGPTLPGLVTDAAAFPGGRHVLLRTYGDAFVYAVPSWRRLGSFRLPREPQGEGVSIGPHRRVRVVSEGGHARVLQVARPSRLRERMLPPPAPAPMSPPRPDGAAPWWPWALAGVGVVGAGLALRARRRS